MNIFASSTLLFHTYTLDGRHISKCVPAVLEKCAKGMLIDLLPAARQGIGR